LIHIHVKAKIHSTTLWGVCSGQVEPAKSETRRIRGKAITLENPRLLFTPYSAIFHFIVACFSGCAGGSEGIVIILECIDSSSLMTPGSVTTGGAGAGGAVRT